MKTITIAGNLGRDAETRDAGKDTVTSFSVAVAERGRDGEKSTIWFDCSLWGRRGEALAQYLTRGSSVTVSGDLGMRSYQTKDGDARTSLTVRVDQITLQGGRDEARGNGGGRRDEGGRSERDEAPRQQRRRQPDPDPSDYDDDDIPF